MELGNSRYELLYKDYLHKTIYSYEKYNKNNHYCTFYSESKIRVLYIFEK